MVDVFQTFVLALITALATGIGVFPLYWFEIGERALGFLWGLSASVMATISILDLIIPASRNPAFMGIGAGAGVVFVVLAAIWLDERETRTEKGSEGIPQEEASEPASGKRGATPSERDHGDDQDHDQGPGHAHGALGPNPLSSLSLLLFLVFTVHSAPEGIGIGSALKESSTVGLIVTFAIALHNIPEGTAIAVGLRADGVPIWRAFGAAVVTSLPQPILAPLVFLIAFGPWLSLGMGFAGGAMLALVARELVPEGWEVDPRTFTVGVVLGLGLGILLNVVFPVPGVG